MCHDYVEQLPTDGLASPGLEVPVECLILEAYKASRQYYLREIIVLILGPRVEGGRLRVTASLHDGVYPPNI